MNTPALELRNVHVRFGQRQILTGINLTVKPGEIVGLIGPNGCGKTTLLNAVSGFAPVETGSVLLHGNDISDKPSHERARLGLGRGFQNVGIFREMTLRENLLMTIERAAPPRRGEPRSSDERAEYYPWWWMFSRARMKAADEQVRSALSDVGLDAHADHIAGELSGGQLRLLELARLRLSKGSVLLIDEPTAGVAPAMRQVLGREIKKLCTEHGRTIVLIEHDLKFLFDLVERVVVLVDGRVHMEGPPSEVQKDERLREVYFG